MRREYLPLETLPSWAHLNGVTTHGVAFQKLPQTDDDGADKGTAIVATQETDEDAGDVLLSVPADMILSFQMVENHAKSDRYLRVVLDAAGEFARVCFWNPCLRLCQREI